MSHARTQIRLAAAAACTGLTTTGSRVFSPLDRRLSTQVPGLSIDVVDDVAQSDSAHLADQVRTARLELMGFAAVASSVDLADVLDNIDTETAIALSGDAALAALIRGLTWLDAEKDYATLAEYERGTITIGYRIIYRTPAANPVTLS